MVREEGAKVLQRSFPCLHSPFHYCLITTRVVQDVLLRQILSLSTPHYIHTFSRNLKFKIAKIRTESADMRGVLVNPRTSFLISSTHLVFVPIFILSNTISPLNFIFSLYLTKTQVFEATDSNLYSFYTEKAPFCCPCADS